MNRNKVCLKLSLLFFIFALLCAVGVSCPHRPFPNIGGDPTVAYAPAIESELVCDWHSALFLQECIVLKKLLHAISINVSGVDILCVVWYLSAIVIIFVLTFFLFSFKDKIKNYYIFLWFLSFFLLINTKNLVCNLYLDFYFTAAFFALLYLLFILYNANSNVKKRLIIFILFVLLYHMIELRKNSLLLLPFVSFFLFRFIFLVTNKICIWIYVVSFSVAFSFVSTLITQSLFVGQRTYPMSVMMMSDMCLAATLRGDEEKMRQKISNQTGYILKEKVHSYSANIPYFPRFPINQYNTANWLSLKTLYIEEWNKNFDSMKDAKIIQIVEFLFAGYIPKVVVEFYDDKYFLKGDMLHSLDSFPFEKMIFILAWLLTFCIVLTYFFVLCILFLCKRMNTLDKYMFMAASLSLLYLFTYVIVTPTPDARYRAPSLFIFSFVSAMALNRFMSWVASKTKRMRTSKGDFIVIPQHCLNDGAKH